MNKLPSRFVNFQKSYPDLFAAYDELGKQASSAGPLDRKQMALVKLGVAAGAKMEGAVHSHCRRALEAGLTPDEIRHAILLTVTTLGFPSMMACLSWVDETIEAASQAKSDN
ncbi:MAG: carboxymuconolactone decarboxylase family protein [Cyanobacteria bacterium SZAS LIN-3]|nr:carboxymuconolactone decarboxylase family protein [Cyanobacteria bacterium SZAS LIN-3]MBS2006826.1 carboxymuconolactone decarboxylase family protein [Cyanobacteria bacterium SZAS TMP-1]